MTTPDVLPPEPPNPSRRKALVALLLMLVGGTMLTVGASLEFGVPYGLLTLGTLLVASGVLLGLTS
jgi:hypothetical protein